MQVLLIDEETTSAFLTTETLKAGGHTVKRESNWRPSAAATPKADVVIVDVKADYDRFLPTLRSLALKGPPIVVFTAVAKPGPKEEMFDAGAEAVAVKPNGILELVRLAERAEARFKSGSAFVDDVMADGAE